MPCFEITPSFLRSLAIAASLPVLLTVTATSAADLSETPPEPAPDAQRFGEEPEPGWTLIVGAAGIYQPDYEGSDDFEVAPVPFVLLTYSDWLEIDPLGATVTVFQHGDFSLAGKVGYEMGRDQDDNARLRGLGDIDFAATVGVKAAYEMGPFEFYAGVDRTIGGSESLLGTFGVEYMMPVSERLMLGLGVEATVADKKHMESYFGVSAAQSLASGLPQYKAEAGLKRVDVSASAMYMLTENWLVRGEVGVGMLTGDAADSPIVKEEIQPSAMLGVAYKF